MYILCLKEFEPWDWYSKLWVNLRNRHRYFTWRCSPQVSRTLTSHAVPGEDSDGNGSNDKLMEFDWNAHVPVRKFPTFSFHTHDSLNVSTRGKTPLTRAIPTLLGHKGIITSSVSHGRSQASCTAAPAPAPGLFSWNPSEQPEIG